MNCQKDLDSSIIANDAPPPNLPMYNPPNVVFNQQNLQVV